MIYEVFFEDAEHAKKSLGIYEGNRDDIFSYLQARRGTRGDLIFQQFSPTVVTPRMGIAARRLMDLIDEERNLLQELAGKEIPVR